ncbi:GNAT family N-acetyltransferase [Patescibacteria group bacterium]|nr:GNAT family N-acetyltransferase [Patescibacteria group bacterium]MBU1868205.1 GNAT family N-acetyltransferase [Patescibacteria group bacterium]
MKERISIRKANIGDVSEIVRIHRDCVLKTNSQSYSPEQITEWLSQITVDNVIAQFDCTDWHVVQIGIIIVGFAQVAFEECEINQINIRPEYQKRGYGKKMLGFLEKKFRIRGLKEINLNSTKDAEGFYNHMDFRSVRSVKYRLQKLAVEMVLMKKQLL